MRLEPTAKPDHVLRVNSPPAILNVKAALHKHTLEYWRQLSHELLEAETAADMECILQSIT